jgi:hypothetical protein
MHKTAVHLNERDHFCAARVRREYAFLRRVENVTAFLGDPIVFQIKPMAFDTHACTGPG